MDERTGAGHYVIAKVDSEIENLRRFGVSDPALEVRREQHWERLRQTWDAGSEVDAVWEE